MRTPVHYICPSDLDKVGPQLDDYRWEDRSIVPFFYLAPVRMDPLKASQPELPGSSPGGGAPLSGR